MNEPYRRDVIEILEELSIAEVQEQAWGSDNPYGDSMYHIAMQVLLDDTALYDGPYEEIGHILRNEEEAEAMNILTKMIVALYERIGNNRDVEDYRESPEWPAIMEAARQALIVMRER